MATKRKDTAAPGPVSGIETTGNIAPAQTALVEREPSRLPTHQDPAFLAHIPTDSEWEALKRLAADLVSTRMVPAALDTAPKVALVMLKGRELGLPPVFALSEINVIKGKAAASARAMRKMLGDAGCVIDFPEATTEAATCVITRGQRRTTLRFTMAEAARIRVKEDNDWKDLNQTVRWREHPTLMLMNRALSRNADQYWAHITCGARLQEEVEIEAATDGGGPVIDVSPTSGPAPEPGLASKLQAGIAVANGPAQPPDQQGDLTTPAPSPGPEDQPRPPTPTPGRLF